MDKRGGKRIVNGVASLHGGQNFDGMVVSNSSARMQFECKNAGPPHSGYMENVSKNFMNMNKLWPSWQQKEPAAPCRKCEKIYILILKSIKIKLKTVGGCSPLPKM